MMDKISIAIIGGSGLYEMENLKVLGEKEVETPFGRPSDKIIIGELEGKKTAFLPRHGKGHRISPNEINYRANIYALKVLGVDEIISVSAVGSMKDHLQPGHIVVIDQFVDRTKCRAETFFGNGIVAHASFADPVCARLRKNAVDSAKKVGVTVHDGGTYICIEGPMFSSRAESNIYRQWGMDVIGMTNYQEAKLAREAEICYTTLALVTDYDCWHVDEGPVDVQMVIETMNKNVANAKLIIKGMLSSLDSSCDCPCRHALKGAIMTQEKLIPKNIRRDLKPIIGKYLPLP